MRKHIAYIFLLSVLFNHFLFSQNETKKWYFGNQAGLDFMTTPPTILTNGVMATAEGCASIADASGNLLFYTDGVTIYNQLHTSMNNGTGLLGFSSSSQSAIIVKQPGNTNVYYVFTQGANFNGLRYSIVDMSLAVGMGSVTSKNIVVQTGTSEKLTSGRHCNGIDYWILTHDYSGNVFNAYLLTTTGLNTTPVTSSVGVSYTLGDFVGNLKLAPSGKKLADALYGPTQGFQLLDFDNSTGIISNAILLGNGLQSAYGCEFSSDCTKLYGSRYGNSAIYQWDLCAGSATAIAASQYTVMPSGAIGSTSKGALQLASDGKIYVARGSQSSLGVINNPNLLGAACNYTEVGQSIAPKSSWYGLPNFITSSLKPLPTPFTHTVSNSYGCQAAQFNSTYNPSITTIGCSSVGYSLTGLQWNFGDPTSGSANTSTLVSPIHAFTSLGTYSVNLILYYSCGGGTDTLKQVVNINQPCISVSSTSITCANLGSATVVASGGIGPYSYTWMPSGQTNSVATGLSPGTYTLSVFDFGNNFTYTATTLFTSLIPLTGTLNYSGSVTCNGANTATTSVTNIAGGSGLETYLWVNAAAGTTYTSTNPLLGPGIWSLTVTDALTGCQVKELFYIAQPPPMNLVLSSSSPTSCVGTSVTLSGVNSGGTPYMIGAGYTYTWNAGTVSSVQVVCHTMAATSIYTLSSRDSLNCLTTKTIAVDFIANPVLTVANVSICPLQTATLSVSGASSYTWASTTLNTTGTTFTDNPIVNTQYTVVGSALSCTSSATAGILLKPTPFPLLNSNSPICNGHTLNLYGNGGVSYAWQGPLVYSSTQQYPVINAATPNHSGVYSLTVTAANNCTASTSKTVTVNSTPTVAAFGSTVCTTQTLNLLSNSFSGASYFWTGPNSYTSNLQNPSIINPLVIASGLYTVKVTSAQGCTNTASADVTVTALPIPTITGNSPICFGGDLTLNAGGGTSYSWTGPVGFNSALQNPTVFSVTLPNAGIYFLQVTTGPCVNTTSHTVVINPLPSFSLSSNAPVCETKSLSLSASNVSNAVSYSWQGPFGFLSSAQVTIRDSSKLAYSGIYQVTVVDANSCQNSATLAVSISTNPILSTVSTTVCLNAEATLQVNGASTYTWTGPEFYYATGAHTTIKNASSLAPSIYTVLGKAANTCSAIATASVYTKALPKPSLTAYPSNTVCLGKQISLEGFGGITYKWNGPGNFNYNAKVFTFTLSSAAYSGTYTLVVTDTAGCSNSTNTTISFDPLPSGTLLGTTMDACVPFKSNFRYHSTDSSSHINTTWQINNEAVIEGKTFSKSFTRPGEYKILGTFINTLTTCFNTATFVVHAREIPVADFSSSPEKPVENTDEVLFTNHSGGEHLSEFTWYFIKNKDKISNQQNTSYFFKDAGVYPVAMVVKNTWGCADTIIKAITIQSDFNIFVPNAFTPNNDNKNQIFLPVCTGVKFYELNVFNRWGKIVFHSADLNTGWNGTFNGEPCQEGIYVWQINISSTNGEMKKLTGHVTLYR